MSYGRPLLDRWHLDPAVAYLNHGAFGATPKAVLASQDAWRLRVERQPISFFVRDLPRLTREVAAQVAPWLGTHPDRLAFVPNATAGCNTVIAGLTLGPQDVLLSMDHGYPAVHNTLREALRRRDLDPVGGLVLAQVGAPVAGPEQVVAAFEQAWDEVLAQGRRVALLVVDQIASPSGLVMPVAALVDLARRRGARTLVDAAHVPGHLDVDVDALGADWWVGNLHKWAYAPRGCAVLVCAPGREADLQPLVVSHDVARGFPVSFDWTGTTDPTPVLCVPDGLAFARALDGELGPARAWREELATYARARLQGAWGTPLVGPPTMMANLVAVALPGGHPATLAGAAQVHAALLDRAGVEVPVVPLAGRLWVRVSCQVYVEPSDIDRLVRGVDAL